jgi:hypothetical protein
MFQTNYQPKSFRTRAKRERDPLPWRYGLLTIGCGLLLGAGFFLAARMHFSAMDYGMHNAKLRRLKENLEAEQRKLVVAKETAMSPSEINKAARRIGLQEMSFESFANILPSTTTSAILAKQVKTESSAPRASFSNVSSKPKASDLESFNDSQPRSRLPEEPDVSAVLKTGKVSRK